MGIFGILPRFPAESPGRRHHGRVEARWWTLRPAQSLKPASYVCPFCDTMLHATSEHALVAPEGDVSRRRHAHMECVVAERRAGRLVTEDEWRSRR